MIQTRGNKTWKPACRPSRDRCPICHPRTPAPGRCSVTFALIGHIIPFGNIFGPLVVWLIKKDEHPFIDDQGKEAINFQITVTIAFLISGVLVFVFIGVVLLPIVYVVAMILLVIATIKANEGVRYRYPWVLRLIS